MKSYGVMKGSAPPKSILDNIQSAMPVITSGPIIKRNMVATDGEGNGRKVRRLRGGYITEESWIGTLPAASAVRVALVKEYRRSNEHLHCLLGTIGQFLNVNEIVW
jgi:hypothetical protein